MDTRPTIHANTETDFVQTQMLALVAGQSHTVFLGVMGASVVLMSIGYQPSTLWWWLSWIALVALGQVVRMRVQTRVPSEKEPAAIAQSVRRGVAVAALCGSVQTLCLVSFPSATDTARVLFTLILLGLATGAVSNSAGHFKTYLAYSLPLIVPLSLLWMVCSGQNYSATTGLAVGTLILVCITAILVGYARTAWRLFDESCRIRFRESDLNARLVKALGEAEQANRAKTRFLAAASHDLRQPLHAISLISAALGLRPLDPESKEIVTLLNQVTASLSSQLDSLLDISKLDADVVTVQPQTISVPQLLEQLYAEFAPLAYGKNLTPVLDLRTTACIETDPLLLLRVLNNLSQNALKFTQQGSVTFHAHNVANTVVIAVSDTGCGIAEHHQEEIFQEFYQVSNNARDPAQGLGLGLSIVRRITKLLHISLTLQSSPDQGTTIRLHLPIAQPANIRPATPAPAESEEGSKQFALNVLVIDDEISVRRASQLLLTALGCRCELAHDILSAQECVRIFHPDLIIADLRLRGPETGIDAIATLRTQLGPVPALLISGDTAPERLTLARDAGIRMCHKPLTLEKLSSELRLLEHPRHTTRGQVDEHIHPT